MQIFFRKHIYRLLFLNCKEVSMFKVVCCSQFRFILEISRSRSQSIATTGTKVSRPHYENAADLTTLLTCNIATPFFPGRLYCFMSQTYTPANHYERQSFFWFLVSSESLFRSYSFISFVPISSHESSFFTI